MFRTVTPILSAIIAILIFVFFTKPEYEKITALKETKESYVDTIKKYEKFNTDLNNLISKKNDIPESDRDRINEFVPSQIDTALLIVKLEKLSKDNGLLFGNIKANDGADKKLTANDPNKDGSADASELVSADISFDVIGTYPQFKNLLKSIESSLTLVEVTRISLNSKADTQFSQYSLTVRVYGLGKRN